MPKYARWVLAHIRAHLDTGQYGEAAPARKLACELVAWFRLWHGSDYGMAQTMAWLRPWHGSDHGTAQTMAWLRLWHGSSSGMAEGYDMATDHGMVVAWKTCTEGSVI